MTDKPMPLEFPIVLECRNVDFCGGRKTRELGEKPLEQGQEPTSNSTHLWHRVRESNHGHIGGRRARTPLRHPCWMHLHVNYNCIVLCGCSYGCMYHFWTELGKIHIKKMSLQDSTFQEKPRLVGNHQKKIMQHLIPFSVLLQPQKQWLANFH